MTDNEPSDLQILELASRRYRRAGARDRAIADELGLGSTAYARRLLQIVHNPSSDAVQQFGPLIRRLDHVIEVGRLRRAAR